MMTDRANIAIASLQEVSCGLSIGIPLLTMTSSLGNGQDYTHFDCHCFATITDMTSITIDPNNMSPIFHHVFGKIIGYPITMG